MNNERRKWSTIAGLLGFGCIALVAIFADLIASNTPVLMRLDGKTFVLPALSAPHLVARKTSDEIARRIDERGGWAVWPLLVAERVPSGDVESSVERVAKADATTAVSWWAHAARATLAVAGVVTIAGLVIGLALGAAAALGPGLAEALLARSVELVGAFPAVILVALVQAMQPGAATFIATLTVLRSLETARIVHGRTLQVMAEDFVTAARALGVSNWQLFRRHLLPHVVGAALVSALLSTAVVVALDAALAFLGLRTMPRLPSWGDVLGVAPRRGYWTLSLSAAAGVVATVSACFLLAEALSEKVRAGGTRR